jgi:hypothetical protein
VGCEKVEVRSDSFADDAGNEELRRIIHALASLNLRFHAFTHSRIHTFMHLELGENDF